MANCPNQWRINGSLYNACLINPDGPSMRKTQPKTDNETPANRNQQKHRSTAAPQRWPHPPEWMARWCRNRWPYRPEYAAVPITGPGRSVTCAVGNVSRSEEWQGQTVIRTGSGEPATGRRSNQARVSETDQICAAPYGAAACKSRKSRPDTRLHLITSPNQNKEKRLHSTGRPQPVSLPCRR